MYTYLGKTELKILCTQLFIHKNKSTRKGGEDVIQQLMFVQRKVLTIFHSVIRRQNILVCVGAFVCVCICVYMCIYMCIYIYVYIYVYIYICVYIYI